MNLRTFTADSLPQALQLVRQAYGAEGVILHTRTFKRGGVLGLGAKMVVEVTAGHAAELGRRRSVSRRKRAHEHPAQRPRIEPTAGDLIKRTYMAARAELQKRQSAGGGTAVLEAPAVAPADAQAAVVPPRHPDELTAELQAVRRMVNHLARQQSGSLRSRKSELPDSLFEQYLALIEQEVAEELAAEVIDQVRERLPGESIRDEQACRTAVREALASLVPCDGVSPQITVSSSATRPHKIALVGPTGVGKTTTIAKLAATFKLQRGLSVALITMDTYRIAAVDQLRTYAGIIGVPLHVAVNPQQMSEAIDAASDCDVVLIDTAGRSPRDAQRLSELRSFLDAADPDEVHLVLASTCTQSALMDAVERFSSIRTDRIIFTKLDEAVNFGVLLNVARQVNKQLSYITTGQEVPHQIERAASDRLASLVMGEGI